ncbi:hypothetical protein GALMADRAFT_66968 [Galerina marginata CBS 339.88]|uniref:G-protein coupled receptors family 1 profile domain-containing protein n=1 Tax=Galerina marginata (strain CBS 339.88) TaxID=685588 RepID=A0A067T375_GALM3|nr:hypothetical protein GALMADRAFT_66968 [Galerina marginata CBS 339.88]
MTPETPNPFTPLAFLDPKTANQFEVARYITAVTVGIYLWDLAINLPNDILLLTKHKIRLPTIIYYLSRFSSLGYVITCFFFQVLPMEHCEVPRLLIGISWTTSQALTSSLFFMRVRAVYHHDKFIQGIFFFLWISVAFSALTVPIGIRGAHIGPTMQCLLTQVPSYTEASAWTLLVNDSAIFFAITYRIIAFNIVEDTFKARLKAFVGRGSIPQLSRSLLIGGQHYYLIALFGNILLLVLVIGSSFPPIYRGMGSIPVTALTNLMACIVFRKVKFGHIPQDGTTFTNGTYSGGQMGSFPGGPRRVDAIRVDINKSTVVETHEQCDFPLNELKPESQVNDQV